MIIELSPFERWMVQSNLDHVAEGEDGATVVAQLRTNGYLRVASAVEASLKAANPRGASAL